MDEVNAAEYIFWMKWIMIIMTVLYVGIWLVGYLRKKRRK